MLSLTPIKVGTELTLTGNGDGKRATGIDVAQCICQCLKPSEEFHKSTRGVISIVQAYGSGRM